METRKIEKNMGKVWEWLKMGYTVELNNYTYAAIEDEKTKEWHLCIKTQQFVNGSFVGEDIYLDANLTVDQFDKLVNKISDDDYFLLASQAALTKINRNGGIIKISNQKGNKEF